jgi:hypothetical protein
MLFTGTTVYGAFDPISEIAGILQAFALIGMSHEMELKYLDKNTSYR